eukprot:s3290_g4.t1
MTEQLLWQGPDTQQAMTVRSSYRSGLAEHRSSAEGGFELHGGGVREVQAVLQREGAAPSQNEPTGEPESLRGRVYQKMGDLVQYDKPKDQMHPRTNTHPHSDFAREIEEFKEKKKKRQEEKRKEEDVVSKKAKMDINKGETVLSTDVTEMQIYRPRTAQTKAVYEMLLNRLQQPLGDQAPDVLRGAADEVLAAIKTEGDVEEVLGSITDEYFAELFRLAKQITDFGADVEDEEQDSGADGTC